MPELTNINDSSGKRGENFACSLNRIYNLEGSGKDGRRQQVGKRGGSKTIPRCEDTDVTAAELQEESVKQGGRGLSAPSLRKKRGISPSSTVGRRGRPPEKGGKRRAVAFH